MSAEQARTEADAGVAAGTAASADSEEKDVKIPVEDAVETADEKDDAPQTAGATDSIDAEEATMTEEEMVEVCVSHMAGPESGFTEEQARSYMQGLLPQLKRWKG